MVKQEYNNGMNGIEKLIRLLGGIDAERISLTEAYCLEMDKSEGMAVVEDFAKMYKARGKISHHFDELEEVRAILKRNGNKSAEADVVVSDDLRFMRLYRNDYPKYTSVIKEMHAEAKTSIKKLEEYKLKYRGAKKVVDEEVGEESLAYIYRLAREGEGKAQYAVAQVAMKKNKGDGDIDEVLGHLSGGSVISEYNEAIKEDDIEIEI